MSTLKPVYTNAIILWGQEACEQFGRLIQHWNTLLEPAGWDRFVFVLVSDPRPTAPEVPENLTETLLDSCFSLSAQSKTCPEDIVDALRQRINGNKVLLQCVCSDFDKQGATPENPLLLARKLANRFEQGTGTVFYLMLHEGLSHATAAQRAFLEALREAQRENMTAYPCLVSGETNDGSTIAPSARWRAVFLEMLANSAGTRTLLDGSLYSLGYSVLNADDSELRDLRRQNMRKIVLDASQRETDLAQAWKQLTQGLAATELFADRVPRPAVLDWISQLVKQETVLPDDKEKANNRILSRAYETDPREILGLIQRFYELNFSRADWKSFKARYLEEARKILCCTINAPAFHTDMVKSVIEHLQNMQEARENAPQMPRRSFLSLPTAYGKTCCLVSEKYLDGKTHKEQTAAVAKALCEALEALLGFIRTLKSTYDEAEIPGLTNQQLSYLMHKYPNYWKSISDVSDMHGDRLFSNTWLARHAPYYTSGDEIVRENWLKLIQEGEEILQKELPASFRGSFCQALGAECATNEELGRFFEDNLQASKRMLYNVYDSASPPQSLYFADSAFENHPWISNRRERCIIACNDNVERVDLYTLSHDISWYLGDPYSRYFGALSVRENGQGDAGRLFNRGQGGKPAAQQEQEQERVGPQEEDKSRGLTLRDLGQDYILSWNWKAGASTATVRIHQDGKVLQSIPCSYAEFMTEQGIKVTHKIPFGKMSVSVFADGILYAYRDMAGRRNKVSCHLERMAAGLSELTLSGQAEDIRKLVLAVQRRDGKATLYYPINPDPHKEEQRFRALQLPQSGRTEVRPYPGVDFPQVETVKR